MAFLGSTNLTKVAIKKASAWNTEVSVSSGGLFLYASSIAPSGGYEDFIPRDFGTSGKRKSQKRLKGNFSFSVSCDATFSQAWLALFGQLMGTESTPAEQTVGQGDYLHNFDLADSIDGLFWTMVWKVETNKVRAFPSAKITSFSFDSPAPGVGTVSFQGIADEFVETTTSTTTHIDALAPFAYESAVFGAANTHLRFADYSTSTPLSSTNDMAVQNFKIQLSRPMTAQHASRGALSAKCFEPSQQGDIDGMVEFTLFRLDAATYGDLMAAWYNATVKMAELQLLGSAIGTGLARTLKFQFPYIQAPGEIPQGQAPAGNNQYWTPTFKGRMLVAPAAAAGMSGFTDYLRLVSIDQRGPTKWIA